MTPEQLDTICERVANGISFRAACRELKLDEGTARSWLNVDGREVERARVKAARDLGCDAMADQCIEIADRKDLTPNERRVMVDTRLRLMGKWNQAYSEKVKHVGGDAGDAPIRFAGIDITIIDPSQA